MSHIVIIGSAAAGYSFAEYLREMNSACDITLVSQGPFFPCDKRKLLGYFGNKVKEKELYLCPADFFKQNNIMFLKETKAVSINPGRRTVQLKIDEKRDSIPYDVLVVCTGRETFVPEIPGVHKEGVCVFDSLKDFKSAKSMLITDTVCLAGAWNDRAMLLTAFFQGQGKEVKYVGDAPFAAVPASVEHVQSTIVEVIGESGVQAIKLQEGKIIGTSLLVFCGPIVGATGFLKDSGIKLDSEGFIAVDNNFKSSIDGVFACGAVTGTAGASWDRAEGQAIAVAEHVAAGMDKAEI